MPARSPVARAQVTIAVDDDVLANLRKVAARRELELPDKHKVFTYGDAIREAIDEYLERQGQQQLALEQEPTPAPAVEDVAQRRRTRFERKARR